MAEPRAARLSGHTGLPVPTGPVAPAAPLSLLAAKRLAEKSSVLAALPLLDATTGAARRSSPERSGSPATMVQVSPYSRALLAGAKRNSPDPGGCTAGTQRDEEQHQHDAQQHSEADRKTSGKPGEDRSGHGRAYVPWSAQEEESLRRGVQRHGVGAWQVILRDPEYDILKNRTGIQLKDKWRNLIKFNHLSREESIMAVRTSDRKWKRPATTAAKSSTPAKPNEESNPPPPAASQRRGSSGSPPAARAHHDAPSRPPAPLPKLNIDFHRSLPKPGGVTDVPAASQRLLMAINREEEKEAAACRAMEGGEEEGKRSPPLRENAIAKRPAGGRKSKSPRRDSPPSSSRPVSAALVGGMLPLSGSQLAWLPAATPMHAWARWSEMHMASMMDLRMLLAESLQIQAEADNSLLETVAHFRCGAKGVESVHQALQICDMANDKVQLTYKLMDDWRRKICFESSGLGR